MKNALFSFVFLFFATVCSASDLVYGPANNNTYGPYVNGSLVSVFRVNESSELSQISAVQLRRGSFSVAALYELDDYGNVVNSVSMRYSFFTAAPGFPAIGTMNVYMPTEPVFLKPFTKYGFHIVDANNGWMYSDKPMGPLKSNRGPIQIQNYQYGQLGFYPILQNLIVRVYTK